MMQRLPSSFFFLRTQFQATYTHILMLSPLTFVSPLPSPKLQRTPAKQVLSLSIHPSNIERPEKFAPPHARNFGLLVIHTRKKIVYDVRALFISLFAYLDISVFLSPCHTVCRSNSKRIRPKADSSTHTSHSPTNTGWLG